jgi:hypothetical protein
MSAAALLLLALAATGEFERPQTHTLAELERRFSIEIVVEGAVFPLETIHGTLDGGDALPEARERYAVLLGQELGLYPPQLVRRARLQRIVLCRDLAFAGQLRAAVPEFASRTLYLDVLRGAEDPRHVRRVIHHEFFHIVDWLDDGELYRDARWTALNEDGFEYGNGGVHAQGDPAMSLWTEECPGFLTRYGRTGVEEDKAELWSLALVHPREVAARAEVDPVLAAKVERLRLLARRFTSELDDGFWDGVARLERPEPRRAVR